MKASARKPSAPGRQRNGRRQSGERQTLHNKTAAERPVSPSQGRKQKINVFISYARSDAIIASALYEQLTEINRERVVCFQDTKTIESGRAWETTLHEALETADWLVCVYTGEQSEFCGYEVGMYRKISGGESASKDSRIICLHDVESVPTVFHKHQNKLVVFPPDMSPSAPQFDEDEFYLNSPLKEFLSDFYKYEDLWIAADAAEAERQRRTLARQVKLITEAFKAARGSDPRADTPTQLRVEVDVPATIGASLKSIPDDALVSGTFQSLGLFGLMPSMHDKKLPATTWGRLKEACSVPAGATVPWMNSLEMDMLDAANERALSGTEAAFQSKIKIYRAILSRHVLYENGSHKFEILFVETLRRKLLGKQETSLMFAGLIVATRFRFAYLEEPDTISAKFSPDAANNEFDRNCWQLRYDFGRLQQEAVELGILDPGAFIAAFGETRRALAEDLLRTSIEGRKRLLAVLPLPGERVLANKRADVSECILEYMRDMEPVNTRFISATLDMFRELLSTETSQPQ